MRPKQVGRLSQRPASSQIGRRALFTFFFNGLPILDPTLPARCPGVEMEALTAVSVARLTVYDMVKSADKRMRTGAVRLLEKSGGRSGHFKAR